MVATTGDFGSVLRSWRQHRRLSQLALANESGISQRHISFLETGRARPSRATVLALSECLNVPLRERNALLHSAGFAGCYAEPSLDDESMAVFRAALLACLEQHEPYPAMVLNGRWNLVLANQGAVRFFSRFLDLGELMVAQERGTPFQMVRTCLAQDGLRPYIRNWEALVGSFLQRARRALLLNPSDAQLPMLIDEILQDPQAPAQWQAPRWSSPPTPAVEMILEKDGQSYRFFTMLAHFGAPRQITLEELSVETFYPADDATRGAIRDLAH
jgi:transcriptional regulator with XRE-family HTH domain